MKNPIALWIIMIILMIGLFNLFTGSQQNSQPQEQMTVPMEQVTSGEVSIPKGWEQKSLTVTATGPEATYGPKAAEMSLLNILISWFPMLLLIGVWVFFMKRMQGGGGGGAMGMGKSRARLLNENTQKVTFADVAGVDEAKEDLQETVAFLRDPSKFTALGGKIPTGMLLVGPPGTGKTLIARAVAGEANVPFFTISGSDFVEMFVGVGASRVRDMFEQGKKNAPCIIFIDEIDAVGRSRGAGLGGGNDEREQTLNQLLVEMDGFEDNAGVIIIAATNRPDVLDPALMRPGRFDRQVDVGLPDVLGREKILKVHMRKVVIAPDVKPEILARGTPGFSGADLANLVNEAALLAARKSLKVVTHREFEEAKDKVMMGAEQKSRTMTTQQKVLVAYHEGGHAAAAMKLKDSMPVHKATIVPRGRAAGMVMRLPEDDGDMGLMRFKDRFDADLIVGAAGRAGEVHLWNDPGKVTAGAAGDIQMMSDIAHKMAMEWGLDDDLGMMLYNEPEGEVFLGKSVTQTKSMSDATQTKVDEAIRKKIDWAQKESLGLLEKNFTLWVVIAEALLKAETLDRDDMLELERCVDAGEVVITKEELAKKAKAILDGKEGEDLHIKSFEDFFWRKDVLVKLKASFDAERARKPEGRDPNAPVDEGKKKTSRFAIPGLRKNGSVPSTKPDEPEATEPETKSADEAPAATGEEAEDETKTGEDGEDTSKPVE